LAGKKMDERDRKLEAGRLKLALFRAKKQKKAEFSAENAEISTQNTENSTENTEFPTENIEIVIDNAEIPTENAENSPKIAENSPENDDNSPEIPKNGRQRFVFFNVKPIFAVFSAFFFVKKNNFFFCDLDISMYFLFAVFQSFSVGFLNFQMLK
jgi:hypothetical protein